MPVHRENDELEYLSNTTNSKSTQSGGAKKRKSKSKKGSKKRKSSKKVVKKRKSSKKGSKKRKSSKKTSKKGSKKRKTSKKTSKKGSKKRRSKRLLARDNPLAMYLKFADWVRKDNSGEKVSVSFIGYFWKTAKSELGENASQESIMDAAKKLYNKEKSAGNLDSLSKKIEKESKEKRAAKKAAKKAKKLV